MSQASILAQRADASVALGNRAVVMFVSFLLLAPSALFAGGLRPIPAAIVIAGCVGVLALIAKTEPSGETDFLDARIDARRLGLFVALAGALFLLGGALHLLYPPVDWRMRDAVLADLSESMFPILYNVDGAEFVLRAPLGMYMVPAAFGRMFGLMAAHVALWTQNSLILGATFYLLAGLGRGWRHVCVMMLFAGLSLLGIGLYFALAGPPNFLRLATFGLDAWHPAWQYTASVAQFFWVPNHALPAWWLATLLLLHARSQIDSATLAASIAGAMFWSPLAVLPAALWLVLCACADFRRQTLRLRNWLAVLAGMCFLPIALYLVTASATIAHGVLELNFIFLLLYLMFAATQFVLAGYVLSNKAFVPKEFHALFLFCFFVLAALPMFRFGPSNDLVMRGSITALVVVAFLFGEILMQGEFIGRRRLLVGYALIAAAAPSALFELMHSLTHPPVAISDCSAIEASRALGDVDVPANYAVESGKVPAWLMNVETVQAKPVRDRRCWSDQDEVKRTLSEIHPRTKGKARDPG